MTNEPAYLARPAAGEMDRRLRNRRSRFGLGLLLLAVLAPILFVALTEWLWSQGRPVSASWATLPMTCARLQDCRPRHWEPVSGVAAFGYRQEQVVYRFAVPVAEGARVLLLRPHYVDDVRVSDQRGQVIGRFGDRAPGPPSRDRFLYRSVPLAADVSTVTLTIRSTSAILADVAVVSPDLAARMHWAMMGALLFYLALMLGTVGWAVVRALYESDGLAFAFAFKQSADVFYVSVASGLGSWIFAPSGTALDVVSHWVFLWVVSAGLLFYWRLFREWRPPRVFLVLLAACAAGLVIEALLLLVGATRDAMRLNMSIVAVMPVVLLVAAGGLPATPCSGVSRWILVSYFSLLCLPVVFSALAVLSLVPGVPLAMNGLLVHGGLGAVLMTLLLWRRSEHRSNAFAALELRTRLAEARLAHEANERSHHQRFLDLLTHELRAPLSVVRMVVTHPAASAELFAKAAKAVREADSILERSLRAARAQVAGRSSTGERLCLSNVVAEAVERLPGTSRELVRVRCDTGVFATDSLMARLVLDNLLDNALAYSPPGSTVHLRLRNGRAGGVVGCCANAMGPGVRPEADRLFDRFYRGEHARAVSGIGLGLAIVHAELQSCGGCIRARITGAGIIFRFRWPA